MGKKDKVSLKKNSKKKKNRLHIIFSLYKLLFYSYDVNEIGKLEGTKYRDISLFVNKKIIKITIMVSLLIKIIMIFL